MSVDADEGSGSFGRKAAALVFHDTDEEFEMLRVDSDLSKVIITRV